MVAKGWGKTDVGKEDMEVGASTAMREAPASQTNEDDSGTPLSGGQPTTRKRTQTEDTMQAIVHNGDGTGNMAHTDLVQNTENTVQEERVSLFHLISRRTQREQRTTTNVQDSVRGTQTSTNGIVDAFSFFLRQKYGPIQADSECVRHMAEAGHRPLPDDWKDTLHTPITSEELQGAINKGEGTRRQGQTVYASGFSKQPGEP